MLLLRCSKEQRLSNMWLCARPCEAVNAIGASAQGQGAEAANGNDTLSICWLTRRPNQSRGAGGDRRVCVGSHRSSVGDAPRGMRWRPYGTRPALSRSGETAASRIMTQKK
jgi:hypothetical protein